VDIVYSISEDESGSILIGYRNVMRFIFMMEKYYTQIKEKWVE